MKPVLKIIQDIDAANPRLEYDNLGTLFIAPNDYFSGDESAEEPPEDVFLCLPVYAYIHSGVSISCAPYHCPWDSGQCGAIYLTKEKFLKEYGRDNVFTRHAATQYLQGEIETYNQYLTGDIWGFRVVEYETCNLGHRHEKEIDSCWGFYGSDPKTNGMECHLELPLLDYEVITL